MKNRLNILICLLIMIASCKEIYKPEIISSPTAYLVVEGVLNVNGPTSILISRTTNLENAQLEREVNAQVSVEGKDNIVRALISNGDGVYVSPDLNLAVNDEYRLRILTPGGKAYLSDYVKAVETPSIDSIGWRQDSEGLRLFLNTHDATNNTRYYRWDFDETWEVRAYYLSGWIYIPDSNMVRQRIFPRENVYVGWKYDFSKTILLGSSASLASDIILRAPLNFIGHGDEKLAVRYSIVVRQYALDKAGFAFYELMKKNTEGLGTIFDPQPTQMKGNIRNIDDPTEQVVGYIIACTVAEKRIFISNQELRSWHYDQICDSRDVRNHPDSILEAFKGGGLLPWDARYSTTTPGAIDYFVSAPDRCVDVTRRAASTDKPSYW